MRLKLSAYVYVRVDPWNKLIFKMCLFFVIFRCPNTVKELNIHMYKRLF